MWRELTLPRLLARVALALAYALIFKASYVGFLYEHFQYVAGVDLYPRTTLFVAATTAIAVLPIVLYRGLAATSSAIVVLLYLMLYVPIIYSFGLGLDAPIGQVIGIELLFMVSMCVLFLADVVVIRNPVPLSTGWNLMPAVFVLTILSTIYILLLYRGSLRFSSFDAELYEQRFANQAIGAGLVTRYLSSWLNTVLIPLGLGYGLTTKRHRYTIVATIGCVVLYAATANKMMILLPPAAVGFYVLLRGRTERMFGVLATTLGAVIVGLTWLAPLGNLAMVVGSLLLYRTIGNGGAMTKLYYEFFGFHQQTAYSHVSGINRLVHYPYGDLVVGQVVGQFYFTPDMNANANFWATDGIAAMGAPGIGVATAIFVAWLVAVNSITHAQNRLFVVISFFPFMITLLNQSLFSAIWSGGGAFLLLFFLLNRQNPEPTLS